MGLGDRTPMGTYDLRRRRYLGPTSMDTEVAFIMANMAQVGGWGGRWGWGWGR